MGRSPAPEASLAERSLATPEPSESPGVFATPQLEVNILCRLALARYLSARLPRLRTLLGALLLAPGPEDAPGASELAAVTEGEWRSLHAAMSGVRIVDPSCGEGHVLLGMLDILCRLDAVVGMHLDTGESGQARRRRILECNLYGVEVQAPVLATARRRLAGSAGITQGRNGREDGGATLNLACGDSLVERDPFTWDGRFPEVMARGGFHLVIGNPPYLRQERIGDPLGRLSRCQYRDRALAAVYSRISRYFQGSATLARAACPLDGRADICTLFTLFGLGLLHPLGALAFVLPNGLFEARYGQGLQSLLETATHAPILLESYRRRSFVHAGVNTSILLASRSGPSRSALRRVHVDGSLDVLDLRTLGASSTGRSATSGAQPRGYALEGLMDRVGGRLVPLHALGHARYPVKTGNNRFFYPDLAAADAFGIEPEFRRPVLRSPRDVTRIVVRSEDLPTILFACDRSLEDLEASGHTGACAYIRWGAGQRTAEGTPWPLASSLRNRRPWHAVPLPAPADIICPRFYDRRFFFVVPCGAILEDQTFYGLRLHAANGVSREICAAVLNSSLTYLLLETSGRTGLGYGVRQYALCDIADLRVPDPRLVSQSLARDLAEAFQALSRRAILPVAEEMLQPDREALDTIVGNALGIRRDEMHGIRQALVHSVNRRLERARRA